MDSRQRQLNPLERKIHQACLAAPNNTLSQKDIEKICPDAKQMVESINFLLATGLFKPLQGADKKMLFKAVLKEEMKMKKEMTGDENMVLSQIQASGNEGIWTKHLKAKTELHQTVITRCLKVLEGKQLVKSIKSVRHPTRKIYMMYDLEPSVEVTGGPWYTDNELDTEFIKMLSSLCLQYIRDRTLPKGSHGAGPSHRKLYPMSAAPAYPTASQVHSYLQKSRITPTELALEHIQMLLDVLVFDGRIERIPGGGATCDLDERDSGGEEEDEEEDTPSSKKGKRKHRDGETDEDAEMSEEDEPKAKKGTKRAGSAADANGSGTRKKRKATRSDMEDDSEPSPRRNGKKRRTSPEVQVMPSLEWSTSTGDVYRALFDESTATKTTFGWSQSPCSQCKQFDFCDGGKGLIVRGVVDLEEGPVNPRSCVYFGEWVGMSVGSGHGVS